MHPSQVTLLLVKLSPTGSVMVLLLVQPLPLLKPVRSMVSGLYSHAGTEVAPGVVYVARLYVARRSIGRVLTWILQYPLDES